MRTLIGCAMHSCQSWDYIQTKQKSGFFVFICIYVYVCVCECICVQNNNKEKKGSERVRFERTTWEGLKEGKVMENWYNIILMKNIK